jgi:hypothetical protein
VAAERPRRSPRASGVAEEVAAAVRRRQRDRGPRVVLYDEAGHANVIAPSAAGYDELLAAAASLIEAVEAAELERRAAADASGSPGDRHPEDAGGNGR